MSSFYKDSAISHHTVQKQPHFLIKFIFFSLFICLLFLVLETYSQKQKES